VIVYRAIMPHQLHQISLYCRGSVQRQNWKTTVCPRIRRAFGWAVMPPQQHIPKHALSRAVWGIRFRWCHIWHRNVCDYMGYQITHLHAESSPGRRGLRSPFQSLCSILVCYPPPPENSMEICHDWLSYRVSE